MIYILIIYFNIINSFSIFFYRIVLRYKQKVAQLIIFSGQTVCTFQKECIFKKKTLGTFFFFFFQMH